MTKAQRTIATLLVLVAALLGGIVIVQTSSPAEAGTVGGTTSGAAGDGTCPSDVNGDLVVNVLDLIDLLLDFGAECPGPQLVGVASIGLPSSKGPTTLIRIWSDGFSEYKVSLRGVFPGWGPQEWTPLPVNPDAPSGTRMVAITEGVAGAWIWRLWADGTVDQIEFVSMNRNFILPAAEGWITEPN